MKHLLILIVGLALAGSAAAQTAAFTYQGRLSDNGVPANGGYEFQFTLRDALTGGGTVGSPQALSAVPVANGVFTVTLDFGSSVFTGAARWLEIGVRTNGSAAAYAVLAPRQPITTVPYATYAMTPAGPQGAQGPTGPIGPAGARGLTFKGVWSSATTYGTDDAVFFSGSAWLAKRANSNVSPIEGADWTMIVQKGDTGAIGPAGPQGPQGLTGTVGPQGPSGSTGAQGPQGLTGPQGPRGLNFRGAWSSVSNYATDDAVLSGGSAWLAKRANSSVFPVEGADWTLLVQQGAVGSQGPAGPTGSTGAQGIQGLQGAPGLTGPQGPAGPADASAVSVGILPDARLSANIPLGNGTNVFIGTNRFAGIVLLTNANNQIVGLFTGNGAGLTNLPPAALNGVLAAAQIPALDAAKITSGTFTTTQIPALDTSKLTTGTLPTVRIADAAVTDAKIASVAAGKVTGTLAVGNIPSLDAAKITSGTFTAAQIPSLDGSKLTTGTVADARLSANIPLGNGTNVFIGTNRFAGIVLLTNANNQIVGLFTGNGAGLTNLPPAALNGVLASAQLPGTVVYRPELTATNSALLSAFAADLLASSNGLSARLLGTNTALVNALLAEGTLRTNAQGAFTAELLSVTNGLSARLIATNGLLVTALATDLLTTSNGLSSRLLATNSALTAALAQQLSSLLTDNQVYSGSNHHTGILVATNATNQLVGTFTGNGAGLTNLSPSAVSGTLVAAQIPALDAAKITSGTFTASQIPSLDAAKIASGTFSPDRIPNLDAGTISGTFTVGNIPNLDAAKITSGTFTASQIPSLDGSKLTTGTVADGRLSANVPRLDGTNVFSGTNAHAGVIILTNANNQIIGVFSGNGAGLTNLSLPVANLVGTLAAGQIPALDASKITSGTFGTALIADGAVTDAKIAAVAASKVSGTLTVGNIPSLDAAKITTGTFTAAHIPSLDAAKVTSGVFATAQIPNLDAGKVTTGTLDASRIPSLDGSKIASGTVADARLSANIPLLNGTNAFTGTNNFAGVAIVTNGNNQFLGAFTGNGVGLTNLPSSALSGTLVAAQIPALDAAKISSGTFGTALIADGAVTDAKIAAVAASKVSGTLTVGNIPSLDAAKITTGTFTAAHIPSLDAAKVTSGVFATAQIPNLDAGKVTTGTLDASRIPSLDGSKIASGTVADARLSANVPLLNGTNVFSGTNAHAGVIILTNANNQIIGVISGNGAGLTNLSLPVANLVGTLAAGQIPALDASKITSGTFGTALIADGAVTDAKVAAVAASKVSGTLTVGNIPNLDAAKITTGTFTAAHIPSLDAAKVTSGTLDANRIPSLDGSKIASGTVADIRLSANIPRLDGTNAFSGTNNFAGVAIATNGNNQFLGTFTGNGAGLTNLPPAALSGTLVAAQIPALDAAKITSGTFTTALIPSLDAGKITSGTFGTALIADGAVTDAKIAGVAAGKVSGTLAVGNIPSLDAAKITSGTFTASQIPSLDAGKITTGTFGSSTIADGAILTAKLADGAVTDAKVTSISASKIGGSAPGFVPWQVVSGTLQPAAPNTGYLLTNDSFVALTLPASPAIGDVVRISGTGAAGWRVSQGSGQSVAMTRQPTATDLAARQKTAVFRMPHSCVMPRH